MGGPGSGKRPIGTWWDKRQQKVVIESVPRLIEIVLRRAGHPMRRDDIVEEVQRLQRRGNDNSCSKRPNIVTPLGRSKVCTETFKGSAEYRLLEEGEETAPPEEEGREEGEEEHEDDEPGEGEQEETEESQKYEQCGRLRLRLSEKSSSGYFGVYKRSCGTSFEVKWQTVHVGTSETAIDGAKMLAIHLGQTPDEREDEYEGEEEVGEEEHEDEEENDTDNDVDDSKDKKEDNKGSEARPTNKFTRDEGAGTESAETER